jgi:pyrimidine-nucleoside phosphorylase
MDLRHLIDKKREGLELSPAEIRDWIAGLVADQYPDYQLSALLMAIVLRGMSLRETVDLTREMARHGSPLPRARGKKRIGKHSTGGVGDMLTFLVGPLVADYGVQVPFMSGRGLGHTGGTIDKLSGIPRIKTALSNAQIQRALRFSGFCIFEQTQNLAPADRRLYALRDASGTVPSIPLIVSSILSKKMQEGLDGLVLDVKYGLGSLMGSLPRARLLAQTLVVVAKALKLKAHAVLSAMDEPLGQWVGNNLEIKGCLEVLQGGGSEDVIRLSAVLSREMLKMALPRAKVPSTAELEKRLGSGKLLQRFLRGLKACGASESGVLNLPAARHRLRVPARRSGWVGRLDAKAIGEAAMHLGAGRKKLGDPIDPSVGIRLWKKRGERVQKNEPLAEIYFNRRTGLSQALAWVESAFQVQSSRPPAKVLWAGMIKNY